ncbi:SH3 domain-containing protein [Phenylobacterium sp.]|uniref:SH3 domain-containing protein n=1 Tax=Phenylobacterium sp. TaxID=1871053 RepID=UPI002812347D|nr:SH3 domain-containing protein [Phenylobacterium sp.]
MKVQGAGAPKFAALGVAASLVLNLTVAGAALAADRPTPSGLPVPRYVTLKFGKVNARAGPGDDHRLLWVYRTKGLPVQVVAETAEWRRVCDPEGGLAWVHKRVTDGRRSVMNLQARPQPLSKKPKPGSETVAYLGSRSLASLVRCQKGWCRVKADRATGWVREGALWGTAERAQCR